MEPPLGFSFCYGIANKFTLIKQSSACSSSLYIFIVFHVIWRHLICQFGLYDFIKRATSRLKLWKVWIRFFNLIVCIQCQSSPSLTICVPSWFIIITLGLFYLCKVILSGFLQFKGNFVSGQNYSKDRDWAPLKSQEIKEINLNQARMFMNFFNLIKKELEKLQNFVKRLIVGWTNMSYAVAVATSKMTDKQMAYLNFCRKWMNHCWKLQPFRLNRHFTSTLLTPPLLLVPASVKKLDLTSHNYLAAL